MKSVANTYFTRIAAKAEKAGIRKNTEESHKWFIDNLKNIRNISRKALLNDNVLTTRSKPLIGRMFMYFYDPKYKETLPYYDQFPLIIMVEPAKNGFYGLNLHYLPPRVRAVFFDRLLEYANNKKLNPKTRLMLTYEMLSSTRKLRAFQPCYKRYLFDHIASKVVEVPPTAWEAALFLPTDSFVYADRRKIWRDSLPFQK
jgi:hypothetical protein